MLNDLIAGAALMLAALGLALRHIMLAPGLEIWPSAGPWLRAPMFILTLVMTLRGADLIFGVIDPAVPPLPPVPWLGVSVAVCWAWFNLAQAWFVWEQRAPAEVWARFRRTQQLLRCRDGRVGKALAILSMRGVRVVAPMETDLVALETIDPPRDLVLH